MENEADASLEAVNTNTNSVETSDRKIAYRSMGKGVPILLLLSEKASFILGHTLLVDGGIVSR
ncbi:MAG: hypothetical protein WBL68_06690 [Nitrososphaeraceae archaeon]